MREQQQSQFLRVTEVAELVGLRRSRVYELVASGAIPSVRLSQRRILVPREGIEALARAAVEDAIERQRALRSERGA
jgi:excisionase family DNA binding protein